MRRKSIDDRIIGALVKDSPLQAGELQKACGKTSQTAFYNHCRRLLKEGRIVNRKKGRSAFYALPEDAWKLKNAVANRTALEAQVIKGAWQILDESLTSDFNNLPEANRAISTRSKMLLLAVDRLRVARPALPDIGHPRYKEHVGANVPDSMVIPGWYKYWLDVLEAFGAL